MTAEQVDARPVLATALITAIDHVGIAVADLDEAIKWYHDHLGMIVLHEEVNPGLQQFAYRVSDIDALSERLREQGVRLIYDAPRCGTSNSRINFIHPKDAGGVLIELVEPAQENLDH